MYIGNVILWHESVFRIEFQSALSALYISSCILIQWHDAIWWDCHVPCVKTMALGGQTRKKSGFVPWNTGKQCTSRVKQIIIFAALAEKLLRLGEHRVSEMRLQFACGISRIVCLNKLNIPFKLNRCSNIVSSRWCIMFNWIILLNTLLNGAG